MRAFAAVLVLVGSLVLVPASSAQAQACDWTPSSQCPAAEYTGTPFGGNGSWPCAPWQGKANRRSGIYHLPGWRYYNATYADALCFEPGQTAQLESLGFRASMVR